MAKKKQRKSTAPLIIDDKILKEQRKICKKWQTGRDVYLSRIGLLGIMKSSRRAIKRYKKKELDQLVSSGMGYSQKKYQKELKKEIKLIEDIKKESAALLTNVSCKFSQFKFSISQATMRSRVLTKDFCGVCPGIGQIK